MPTVSPSQSNAGDLITASAINTPINQLAAIINGGIDVNNLADGGVTSVKVADGSISATKLSTSTIKLGYSEVTTSTTVSTTTDTEVTGLATTVTVPVGGRDVELILEANYSSNVASVNHVIKVWDGAVGSGTLLRSFFFASHIADINVVNSRTNTLRVAAPTAGSKTYRVSLSAPSSSVRMYADTAVRSSLTVKAI